MSRAKTRTYFGLDNDSLESLGTLIADIRNSTESVLLRDLKFVRPYCVAVLDQQFRRQQRDKRPCIALRTTSPEVNRYLKLFHFRHLDPEADLSEKYPSSDLMIAVRRFNQAPIEVEGVIAGWAQSEVLRHFPRLSRRVEKSLVENFWEIMTNGLIHSNSPEGITACGQFYPQKNQLEIAFHDAGVGIPHNVRAYFSHRTSWPDPVCIEWALQEGNSTRGENVAGGLGLHVLKEFIAANNGVLHIVSGRGVFCREGKSPPTFHELEKPIDGTLLNIVVNSDNLLYMFTGEKV